MRILLIGYGKMGKTIERIAGERGHQIAHIIDINNRDSLQRLTGKDADVAIEFTQPESAYENIQSCIINGIPVISGTTGWLDKKPDIEKLCTERGGTFFYASNFSIGVNIFIKVNRFLSKIMNGFTDYDVRIEEIHHTEKKDAPSGTAITLAEGILERLDRKRRWTKETSDNADDLVIASKREKDVPGTHTVSYYSLADDIEIKHTAHSREGFALGAVLAAEWIVGKKGVLSMDDYLQM